MIIIEDPADPRVADYVDVRERDLVGRRGVFIAEGEVVLHHLLTSAEVEPVSVLLEQARAVRLGPAVTLHSPQTPVYVAAQPVLDRIAGFPLHRGILAVGRRTRPWTAASLMAAVPPEAVFVVLVGIGNHDNIGGLFRNAAAFGAAGVLLDDTCADPLYRKAIRVSVGAVLSTPYARCGRVDALMAALCDAGCDIVALSPSGEIPLSSLEVEGRVAAVFGAEGPGLPPEVLARSRTVRIPMANAFDSLNVATASGVVLNHLTLSRRGG